MKRKRAAMNEQLLEQIEITGWHVPFTEAGVPKVFCYYLRPGERASVRLGRARSRCPRCGAELKKGRV